MAAVRSIEPGDLDAVGAALARAFADDPVFTYLTPWMDDAERARKLAPFFRTEAAQRSRDAGVWTSDGGEGAAIWAPPGRWRTPVRDGLALAWVILRAAGPRALRGLAVLRHIEQAHPKAPHWYLATLGTDPAHQGRGIGAALLAPVLERCDGEGIPAYLESSKESNVLWYERFGFRVTSELALPRGGPTLWPMWREPS